MKVELIAISSYLLPDGLDSSPGSLIEHAGRICYRSRRSEIPSVQRRFIQRLVGRGHLSVVEHGHASFEVSGISRVCSHQLVRHRLASFSQESQRYVDMGTPDLVTPPSVADNAEAMAIWTRFMEQSSAAYKRLRALGIKKEDARFLLPNAVATKLVVSANFRELLHIFSLRISQEAQWEIRELAARMLLLVYPHAPAVFGTVLLEKWGLFPDMFSGLADELEVAYLVQLWEDGGFE